MTMLNRKAFTLVETVTVIGIIGVLLALSLPLSRSFASALHLNASARAVASELRLVQGRAILEHRTLSPDLSRLDLAPGIKLVPRPICFSPSGCPPPGGSGTLFLSNRLGSVKKVIVSSSGRVRVE